MTAPSSSTNASPSSTPAAAPNPSRATDGHLRVASEMKELAGVCDNEIFGGYLYSHEETVATIDALHNYDCLRANKTMMAWGVEAHVPFLDLEFLDTAMSLDAHHKMAGNGRIEKDVLREAFDGYLPDRIL